METFIIQLPKVLVVSFVGYQNTKKMNGQPLTIVLKEDTKVLDRSCSGLWYSEEANCPVR